MKEFKRFISIASFVSCIACVIVMACDLTTRHEATKLMVTLYVAVSYIGGAWVILIDRIDRHVALKRAALEEVKETRQVMGPQARQ